jgi:hypothetical protein
VNPPGFHSFSTFNALYSNKAPKIPC